MAYVVGERQARSWKSSPGKGDIRAAGLLVARVAPLDCPARRAVARVHGGNHLQAEPPQMIAKRRVQLSRRRARRRFTTPRLRDGDAQVDIVWQRSHEIHALVERAQIHRSNIGIVEQLDFTVVQPNDVIALTQNVALVAGRAAIWPRRKCADANPIALAHQFQLKEATSPSGNWPSGNVSLKPRLN